MTELRRRPRGRVGVGVVGFLGMLVIAAVVYFSFAKRVPFVEGYRIDAVFSNTSQVRKGSPVRIAGVDVGKVVEIKKGPGTTAQIEMEFKESGRPLHRDATLRIRPRLFLEGGFYIELRPGSPSAPELPDKGTIPLSQTAVPVQFDQVLTSLDRPTRESLRRTIDNLAQGTDAGAAKALGDSAEPFLPALRDTAQVAQAARGIERHDLSQVVTSLATIAGTLAENDRQLGEMVTALDTTSGALASESGNLRAGIREADRLARTAVPQLRAIGASLPSLERLATALRPSLPAAPGTLRHVSALLAQAQPLVQPAELPALLTKLTPTVDRLPTLSRRLRTLFPLVTPVSDCLRDRVIPALETKIDDGKLSTGRPVWQDLVHAAVGLAGASQNFDANGPSVRYLAAAGESSIATGPVPGIGQLVGLGPQIVGSTPRWLGNGRLSPFRPDAPCREGTPVDLQRRTPYGSGAATRGNANDQGAAPASTSPIGAADTTPSALRDALRAVAGAVAAVSPKRGGR
jgi:phospholipid/cholesterol/gamma-HCH transport system substrate-binding protein